MLVIRLSRKGRHNHPMYRLTVAENSMPTDGKFVEIVGNYNPTALDQPLVIQKDRIEYWISQGAQPTNTVAKLLNKQGFSLPVIEYNKAPKKKTKTAIEKAATSAVPEKPVEETTAKEEPVSDIQETTEGSGLPGQGVAPEALQNDEGAIEIVEEKVEEKPVAESEKTE